MVDQSEHEAYSRAPSSLVEVYFCYARRDEHLRDRLANHLSSLKRLRKIRDFYDGDIAPGMDLETTARARFEQAHLFLLLISAEFMASDQCYELLQQVLERHRARKAAGIAVLLRPVDWRGVQLDEFWLLPTDRRPVTEWSNTDAALVDVIQGMWHVLETVSREHQYSTTRLPARRLSLAQQHLLVHTLAKQFSSRAAIEPLAVRLGIRGLPEWPADALWNEVLQRLLADNADAGMLWALSGLNIQPR